MDNKKIEIPFGAKDSELCGWEYTIPEGMEAVVESGKVIVRRKESEDERIRKELIDYFNDYYDRSGDTFCGMEVTRIISYLERQKEQPMSAEEVLIRAGLKPYRDGNQWCVLAGGDIQEGICGFGDTIDEALYQFLMEVLKIQKEQKPAELPKSEDYGIDGLYAAVDILQKTLGEVDGYQTDDGILEHQCAISAVKELYEQQPAEWSEEDTEMYINVASSLRGYACGLENEEHKKHIKKELDWLENRFKSLRPQPQGTYRQIVHNIYEMLKDKDFTEITPDHRVSLLNDIRVKCGHADEWAGILDEPSWKPSEDQMRFLLAVINDPNNIGAESCYMTIKSLYNDLKKLL